MRKRRGSPLQGFLREFDLTLRIAGTQHSSDFDIRSGADHPESLD